MNLTLHALLRAIPLAAVALAPEVARAHNVSCGEPYYDPCDAFSGWVDLAVVSTGKIPIDGVLVLQGAFQNDAPGPESVTLSVTTGDEPLAGTIEATEVPGTLIWRPDSAWVAGATYLISGTATNADADGECLPLALPLAGQVTIDAAPASELSPVIVDGMEIEQFSPDIDLATLVCCEGAMPSVNPGDCSSNGSINYDPAQCTPSHGTGYFDLTLTGAPVPMGPVAQQVAFRLNAPDQPPQKSLVPMFGLSFLTAPICVSIDLIELASKEVVAGPEKCFGEGLVAKLGPQSIDASEVLGCALQTCEPNGNSDGWDPDSCEPYDPSDPPTTGPDADSGDNDVTGGDDAGENGEKACACNSSPSPGAGLLLVLGALGLTRRRRIRARARE
jgi:MYXO-CTERM domain-containing protein